MIKVAIAILNWNGKDNLEKYLPSVIKYSNFEGVKIIIIDNGSIDESLDFIKSHYPQIEIIRLDKNYGFAEGYNRGLNGIESTYYLLLNSDVEVTDNWLSPLIEIMEKDENIAACMPKLLSFENRDYFEYAGAAGGFIDKFGYPFCQGRIFNVNEKDSGQYNSIKSIFWATGACMLIRANLFHNSGGFDNDFFAHMEEIDLCWRLKNLGYKVIYNPKSVVYHLGGGTLPKSNAKKTYLNFRNNLFLLYKNLPGKKLIFIMAIRFIFDYMAFLLFLYEFKFNDAIAVPKSHLAFLKSLISLIKKRKEYKHKIVIYNHKEIFQRSIVLQFYLRNIKSFQKLVF